MKRNYRLIIGLVLVAAIFVAYSYQGMSEIASTCHGLQKEGLIIASAQRHHSASPGMIRARIRVSPQTQAVAGVMLIYVAACVALVVADNEHTPRIKASAIFVPPEFQILAA